MKVKQEEIIRQFNEANAQFTYMNEKLEKFGDKLEEVQISIAKLPEALTEKFDERYASKETEKNLNKATWLVVSGVLVALLALVIK